QWGYVVLVLLTALCALSVWRAPAARGEEGERGRRGEGEIGTGRATEPERTCPSPVTPHPSTSTTHHSPLTTHHYQRARWVLLAFVPSSLMLSVTTYLTTDIAAIPLLWVLPLSLYLLTFILSFARRALPVGPFAKWMPVCVLVGIVLMLTEATEPL